jgi:hypothetical protein
LRRFHLTTALPPAAPAVFIVVNLLIVSRSARPEHRIEVEVVAAKD